MEDLLTPIDETINYSYPIKITNLESIRQAYLGVYLRPDVALRLDTSRFPHNTVTTPVFGLIAQLQFIHGAVVV